MSAGPQPSLAPRAYAELELRLDGVEGDSNQVELRFTDSGSDAEINPEKGRAPISLDELLDLRLSPKAYGEKLADQVFHEENVRGLWRQAKASAESKGFFLRLRLTVGASAQELHGLRWELLRDPDSGAALATSERVLLSRFMSSQDLRDVQLVPKTDLKALIAVAAPSNLDEYRLADVDPDGEVERRLPHTSTERGRRGTTRAG